jgi:hypothetical protein
MTINTQLKVFSILLLMLFLDLFLNTSISNQFFTFSLFFVYLFLLGRKYFSNKLIFLLMIVGLFYESIFSTNYIGIFTASILLVVVLSNVAIFFESKVFLFIIFLISYIAFYSAIRTSINFIDLNLLISLLLNFLIFYRIDKLINRDV